MKKLRGFTLIELLIVVAIIAILAAIAVPNFLEAQVRAKVSRVKSDQRSLATAIESYYVDNNQYPAVAGGTGPGVEEGGLGAVDSQFYSTAPTTTGFPKTFRRRGTSQLQTLTTPVAYITSYFPDPFADTRGTTFRFYADTAGWIINSWGPDTDQATKGNIAFEAGTAFLGDNPAATPDGSVETVYSSGTSQPSPTLIAGRGASAPHNKAYTYDPTNGTISDGDVYRTKQ